MEDETLDVNGLNDLLGSPPKNGIINTYAGITFRSMLETEWYKEFTIHTQMRVRYEPTEYRVRCKTKRGDEYCVRYTPDFVLIPLLTAEGKRVLAPRSRNPARWAQWPNIEVKPIIAPPANALFVIGAPVILLCGYPESYEAFVVSHAVTKYGPVPMYTWYGKDWQAAVLGVADGSWLKKYKAAEIKDSMRI